MAKVYHYTDEDGARGIRDSAYIESNNGLDGQGVYFTSLGPRTDSNRLIQNNYDGMRGNWDYKIDYWFSFFVDDFNEDELERLKIPNRDIWVIRGRVDLRESSVPNWTNFGEDSESDDYDESDYFSEPDEFDEYDDYSVWDEYYESDTYSDNEDFGESVENDFDQRNKVKVYHYTDEKGARDIMNWQYITTRLGFSDLGVYFTSLGPRTDPDRLIQNSYDDLVDNWDGKIYWFSFYVDDFDNDELERLKIQNRDIWVIRRGVNLGETRVPNWTNYIESESDESQDYISY